MTQNANTAENVQKSRVSAFRFWVQHLWIDNCEERLIYGQEPATIKQYWDNYKWWIKREYRYQRSRAE